MKKRYDFPCACYLTSSAFTDQRARWCDIIHAILVLLATLAFILACTGCVQSITVRGKYADYTVTPHKPIEIESAKE